MPIHVNTLETPFRVQEGKQAAQSAPAGLDCTGIDSHDSNGLVHKLLSLPSFGKVVYRSNSVASAKNAVSKQHASSSALPKATGLSSSQQMLLQGHASLGPRPPSLEFDSQFESGNLQKAVQASVYCSHHLCRPIETRLGALHAALLQPSCLHVGRSSHASACQWQNSHRQCCTVTSRAVHASIHPRKPNSC